MHSEPVSPELVLVDPELAARERARLNEKARLARLLEAEAEARLRAEPPSPVRRDVRAFARRKLVPAALLASLLANGFLAADLVTRADAGEVAPIETAAASTASTTASVALVPKPRALSERTIAEQKLVALLLQKPARKLPRAFVDPTTGLVRDNVRVVCRSTRPHSYRCVVRSPSAQANGGIVVRYHRAPSGRWTSTWYGYKRNVSNDRFPENRAQIRAKKLN